MLQVEMVHGDRRLRAERRDDEWYVDNDNCCSNEQMATLVGDFFREGCDRFTFYIEDMILVYYYNITIAFDAITGTKYDTILTDNQMYALLMLCIEGDDVTGADGYYATLKGVLKFWPVECRPVP